VDALLVVFFALFSTLDEIVVAFLLTDGETFLVFTVLLLFVELNVIKKVEVIIRK